MNYFMYQSLALLVSTQYKIITCSPKFDDMMIMIYEAFFLCFQISGRSVVSLWTTCQLIRWLKVFRLWFS